MLDLIIQIYNSFINILKIVYEELTEFNIPKAQVIETPEGILLRENDFNNKGFYYSLKKKKLFSTKLLEDILQYNSKLLKRNDNNILNNINFNKDSRLKLHKAYVIDTLHRKELVQQHFDIVNGMRQDINLYNYSHCNVYNYKVETLDMSLLKNTMLLEHQNTIYKIPATTSINLSLKIRSGILYLSDSFDHYFNVIGQSPHFLFNKNYLISYLNEYINIINILNTVYHEDLEADREIKDALISLITFEFLNENIESYIRYTDNNKNNYGFVVLTNISTIYDMNSKHYPFSKIFQDYIHPQFVNINRYCYNSYLKNRDCNMIFSTIYTTDREYINNEVDEDINYLDLLVMGIILGSGASFFMFLWDTVLEIK